MRTTRSPSDELPVRPAPAGRTPARRPRRGRVPLSPVHSGTLKMNVEALDLLATSVFLVNERGHIEYANAAAEDLFGRSRKQLGGQSAATLFDNPENIQSSIDRAAGGRYADVRQLASLRRAAESVEVAVTTVGLTGQRWPVLIETREIEQRVLADRKSVV